MKNILLIGLMLMLITGFTSASGKKDGKMKSQPDTTRSEKNTDATNPSIIENKEAVITLEGNPSTGFTWLTEIADPSIIEIDVQTEYLGDARIVGAPSMFYFTVRPLKTGSTTLKLEYRRPWETVAPVETHFYKVTVEKDGKINLHETAEYSTELMLTVRFESVPMEQGLKMMEQETDWILLDVRRPDEFAAGHIPGAIQLTNEEMTQEQTEKVLPDKFQHIFVYCRSGRRSKEASQKLSDWGYVNVTEIGGILDYQGTIEK